MSEMTMREMIERYVYDVVRRLPQSQREDISRELRTLIDDMMEERADNGRTEQENAEEVLKELCARRKIPRFQEIPDRPCVL